MGTRTPLSVDEVLIDVLGFKRPFDEIPFGTFTGNCTLIKWFAQINKFYGTKGTARIMWKPRGTKPTVGVDEAAAYEMLRTGLLSEDRAFVYHCENHYFCPVGFEMSPMHPEDAYLAPSEVTKLERWVVMGDFAKGFPVLQTKKWEDVVTDLECQYPKCFNIRKSELGV